MGIYRVLHLASNSLLSRTRNAVILRMRGSGKGLSSGNWMAPRLVLNPARSLAKAFIGEGVGNRLTCCLNAANITRMRLWENAGMLHLMPSVAPGAALRMAVRIWRSLARASEGAPLMYSSMDLGRVFLEFICTQIIPKHAERVRYSNPSLSCRWYSAASKWPCESATRPSGPNFHSSYPLMRTRFPVPL